MSTSPIIEPASPTNSEFSDTLSVAAARDRILQNLTSLAAKEQLPLREALNRVLVEDLISPANVPGYTNSAMDGYALAGTDLPKDEEHHFHLIGSAYAGAPFRGFCSPGECVRIMTGAPLPTGTNTVVMQEQANCINEQKVVIGSGHLSGQNVRQVGEDIAAGTPVLTRGHCLAPADLGILASLGIEKITVRRRPCVAFFSTGDELHSIGETLAEGDIYDSNRYSLYGMLKQLNVEILDLGIIKDDPSALKQAFYSAAEIADVVISSGGVSVGEADYTRQVLSEFGNINFWKINMKPGRPLTFGQLHEALFFGLPGNPVAVMVTFYQFVLPALYTLSTGRPYQPFLTHATSREALRKQPGRFEFLRGILKQEKDGELSVTSTGQQGSGILTSMSRANCFILLPETDNDVTPGERLLVQPFNSLTRI